MYALKPTSLFTAPQVSPFTGRNHPNLPALQQALCGAASPKTGTGRLLDGLPGGGHQERCLLRPFPGMRPSY